MADPLALVLRLAPTGAPTDPLNLQLVFGAVGPGAGRMALAGAAVTVWSSASSAAVDRALPYDSLLGSIRTDAGVAAVWGERLQVGVEVSAPHAGTGGHAADSRLPWGDLLLQSAAVKAPWGVPSALASGVGMSTGVAGEHQVTRRFPWGVAVDMHRALRLPSSGLLVLSPGRRAPWGPADSLDSGGSPYAPPARPPEPPGPGEGTTVLLRLCKLGPRHPHQQSLVLGVPCTPLGATEIPHQRYYMSTHTLAVVRLPDNLPLDLFSFRLDADRGSFCWSLSAEGPADLMALLAPAAGLPVSIQITLDGMVWRFLVEKMAESRSHGQHRTRISGRSVPALVSSDYSPQETYLNVDARTAQQLAAEALQGTGVALDWEGVDWLVPPGAWSFIGGPLQAVLRLAEAGGGYVQSHRSQSVLHVRPPYPSLPWAWGAATPDVLISPSAVVRQEWTRADRPAYDGVYVSGETQGVLAHVRRTATAGAVLAPMVTDALVTEIQAARQRGESILGPTGAMADVQLEIPILTGPTLPGVVDVGSLIEVTGAQPWRGLVRGVSVASNWPTVRQTLTIERHL